MAASQPFLHPSMWIRSIPRADVLPNRALNIFKAFRTERFFDDYENAARTGLSKGENIRLVMARNGIKRAVYVGDTNGDREAARFAGIPFLHAAYGYGSVPEADAVLRSFSDLPEAVASLAPL